MDRITPAEHAQEARLRRRLAKHGLILQRESARSVAWAGSRYVVFTPKFKTVCTFEGTWCEALHDIEQMLDHIDGKSTDLWDEMVSALNAMSCSNPVTASLA